MRMRCTMTTGGFGISARLAARIAGAGITLVSVSIDGLEQVHDHLRGRSGSWLSALEAIHNLSAAGLVVVCNSQLNRLTPQLPALYLTLKDAGIRGWQVQITAPMGRAADDSSILFQPPEIVDLHTVLGRIARRAEEDGIEFLPANNVGYFSPYERIFRSHGHPWGFLAGSVRRALGHRY
jgi:MoaA/NifB/PqqE/SkfB family radical SAM enzyme